MKREEDAHLARLTGIAVCPIIELGIVLVVIVDGMTWGLAGMFVAVVGFHRWLGR